MDFVSAISIIVGIVLSFSGVIFALLGANQRRTLDRLDAQLTLHDRRLGELEKEEAVRGQQIKDILAGVVRLESSLAKHIDRAESARGPVGGI